MTSHDDRRDDPLFTPDAEELRLAAEARVSSTFDMTADMSVEEVQHVLHELRVHQIELELQNEQLRETQLRLDAAQAHYADLYDGAPVGYFTLDDTGLIREANVTAATMLGVGVGALVDRDLSRFIVAEDQDIYFLHRREVAGDYGPAVCELRMLRQPDSAIWVRLETATTGSGTDAASRRVAMSDITEQHRIDENLADTDRIATMGLLAAGVAHEINNPLTITMHNTELLVDRLGLTTGIDAGDAGSLRDLALGALDGAQRIAEITKGLGLLSRRDDSDHTLVDVNLPLAQAVRITQNEITARAVLHSELGSVPPVLAKTSGLLQVFVNLLINAVHAVEEHTAQAEISVRSWVESEHVSVEVVDNGRGISSTDVESVFEPFFTTKLPDRGTGLGLAVARKIVNEFNGEIWLESTLGDGTRAVVRLPIADRSVGVDVPVVAAPPEVGRARGRILVVDDDAMVRTVIVNMLGDQHEVVAVDSGRNAKELLRDDQRFDVVLCDLMMPKVSGIDLHAWLVQDRPELADRVVFVTGGVFTAETDAYLRRIGNSVIMKPFDSVALSDTVVSLVSATHGGTEQPPVITAVPSEGHRRLAGRRGSTAERS